MSIDHCLATYGTLAPGRKNHHLLENLRGRWIIGEVRGILVDRGWGSALGFPALIPAEDGDSIEVHLLVSGDLPSHWDRLDAFEGTEYRRAPIAVRTSEGWIDAWIYLDSGPGTA